MIVNENKMPKTKQLDYRIILIVSVILTLLLLLTTGIKTKMNDALFSLSNSEYMTSGYISGGEEKNQYYRLNSFMVRTSDKIITTNILMVDEEVVYQDNYFTKNGNKEITNSKLASNEASISKGTAKKHNLRVGDILILNYDGIDYNYQIKYFFDNYYGFDDINIIKGNQELVIIGFNKEVVKNDLNFDLYFFSNSYRAYLSGFEEFDKYQAVKNIKQNKIILVILELTIVILLALVIEILLLRKIITDYEMLISFSYDLKTVTIESVKNLIRRYLLIFLLPLTINIFIYYNHIKDLIYIILYFTVTILMSSLINYYKIRSV